jgi:hypothetical protein
LPSPFEAEIHSLLKSEGDPALVAAELVRRWEMNILSLDEQADVAGFLLTAGFFPTLFKNLERLLENDNRLPWATLIEAAELAGLDLNDEIAHAVLEGAEEQNAIDDLTRSRRLDLRLPELRKLREDVFVSKQLAYEDRRQAFKDRLTFMKANRLFEEEAKTLAEALLQFPGDREFQQAKDSFEIRWAREIVQNSSTVADPTQDLEWKAAHLAPEEQKIKSYIVARAKEIAAEDPRRAYDLAVTLHFMDFNADALELLHASDGIPAADWLTLELLVLSRQFVTALEHAAKLEVRYANQPDTSFSVLYARARSLHGLGQVAMAIDLLRSLVRIRPGYKSAQSLLMDWSGGDA